MHYSDALNYIYAFTDHAAAPAQAFAPARYHLARMERLLAALGDPHRQFQAVHLTGTKGKGSTAALIESVLRANQQRTGFYTSPHLHTFRERIRVAGEMITPAEVVAGVAKLQPLVAEIPGITTFEIITALAFDYFAARGVELAVIEAGLGGRLDATNVLTPRVAIITSISYDHVAILGNTLAQIAREKAGIIKPGVPIVTAPQPAEAFAVIAETARAQNAPLVAVSADLKFQVADSSFQVTSIETELTAQRLVLKRVARPNFELTPLTLNLAGRHQLKNAATALAALAVLREHGNAIAPAAIRAGLANVEWIGRLELLGQDPFVIVDGAHNEDSAQQLATALRDLFPRSRLHFIFGASSDKDIAGMFAALLPRAASLTLTRSRNTRSADPAQLAALASAYRVETTRAPDVATALETARRRAHGDEVVCVTGSLFVVAEAREAWFAAYGHPLETD